MAGLLERLQQAPERRHESLSGPDTSNEQEVSVNWLSRIITRQPAPAVKAAPPQQALLIRLDGESLPRAIYEEYSLAGFVSQLETALGELGEVDGHAVGATDTIIYLYGPDAEAMYRAVERILKTHPLAQDAGVTIRKGPPGTARHEVYALN